jgi:7-cyano-7-deazaguanine synthase
LSRSADAVVLLSGGLDSTTVLAIARHEGRRVQALSFRYGQRHEVELEQAREQAQVLGAASHEIVELPGFGRRVAEATSLVRESALPVPRGADFDETGAIPNTYVPARNTVFLAHALAWCEVTGAGEIWLGVNARDYSGYPDCRPEYLAAFERLAALATRAGLEGRAVRLVAPLADLHKHEIVQRGLSLGVDYARTVSCYDPTLDALGHPLACGTCESCRLRRRGFELAGVPDPTHYRG